MSSEEQEISNKTISMLEQTITTLDDASDLLLITAATTLEIFGAIPPPAILVLGPMEAYRDLIAAHLGEEVSEVMKMMYDGTMLAYKMVGAPPGEITEEWPKGECTVETMPGDGPIKCATTKEAEEIALKHVWSIENGGAIIVPTDGGMVRSFFAGQNDRSVRFMSKQGGMLGQLTYLLPPDMQLSLGPSDPSAPSDTGEKSSVEYPVSPECDQESEN